MKVKLYEIPVGVEAMVNQQNYVDEVMISLMPDIELQLEKCRKSIYFLMMYTDMKKPDYEMTGVLFGGCRDVYQALSKAKDVLDKAKMFNTIELEERRDKFSKEIDTLSLQIDEYNSFGDIIEISKYLRTAQKLQTKFDTLKEKMTILNYDEGLFGLDPKPLPLLEQTLISFEPFLQLYQVASDLEKNVELWMSSPLASLSAEQIENDVTQMWKTIYKLYNNLEGSLPKALADIVKSKVEAFKKYLPILGLLLNPGLRDRHWTAFAEIINSKFVPDATTKLSVVLEKDYQRQFDRIEIVSTTASKEASFEKTMLKMKKEWDDVVFNPIEYRDTGTYILAAVDDVQTLLDDHVVKIQSMIASPYIKPFEQESKEWQSTLLLTQVF